MGEIEPYSCCWDGVTNGPAGDEELDSLLSNILDFPMESLDGGDGCVANWDASKSDYLGPIPSDVLTGPSFARAGPPFLRNKVTDAPPFIDDVTSEPKQLPYRFEDNSGPFIGQKNKCMVVQEKTFFHSQSPVSVLESGAPSLARKNPIIKAHVCKRARSKRARPSGLGPWPSVPLPSVLAATSLSRKTPKSRERKKKPPPAVKQTIEANSPSQPSDLLELQNSTARPAQTKKCAHCEITKTPQWREGPLGPKTLCNACGVRYRSGRLFPEYRPAASPTFVPSIHSNSHRKVIEMRNRGKQQTTAGIEESSKMVEVPMHSSYLYDPSYVLKTGAASF